MDQLTSRKITCRTMIDLKNILLGIVNFGYCFFLFPTSIIFHFLTGGPGNLSTDWEAAAVFWER
jgi:hypothetical protein